MSRNRTTSEPGTIASSTETQPSESSLYRSLTYSMEAASNERGISSAEEAKEMVGISSTG